MDEIKVYLDNDGIMRVEYPPHAIVTIFDVQYSYKRRLEITKEKVPLLVKIHGMPSFAEDAQKFLCSAEYCAITRVVAVVGDSRAGYFKYSNILLYLFRDIKKPPFDFKVFDNEEAALKWLRTYL